MDRQAASNPGGDRQRMLAMHHLHIQHPVAVKDAQIARFLKTLHQLLHVWKGRSSEVKVAQRSQTQFNHPKEVTAEVKEAIDRLTRSGIIVRDQTVLLKGVNNDKHVMKKLMQELLRIKVVPYYIFNCKKVEGIRHFRPPIAEGIEIIEHMRGYTSGMAVPTFIITAPDGRGKTPMYPQYLLQPSQTF